MKLFKILKKSSKILPKQIAIWRGDSKIILLVLVTLSGFQIKYFKLVNYIDWWERKNNVWLYTELFHRSYVGFACVLLLMNIKYMMLSTMPGAKYAGKDSMTQLKT